MKKKEAKKRYSFDLHSEYKQSWKYLRDSRKFIYFAIGIFVLFALIGFFIPAPQIIHDKIISFIKSILNQTQNMPQLDLISFIISNNVKSTFLGLFTGVFFGVYPLVSALANGYLLGFVSAISVSNGGILELWKIFPHGIFELPAVFISLGLGLKMGTAIFRKKRWESFKNYLVNSLKSFLLIVIPLLIIAGIIEGTLMILIK
ncbi:Stage II sporulation protein M [uncultured archaeon]|nr:Stage II sporulation protein M [uncultured archaeon]